MGFLVSGIAFTVFRNQPKAIEFANKLKKIHINDIVYLIIKKGAYDIFELSNISIIIEMYFKYEDLILDNIETPYDEFKNLNIFIVRHGESESNALQKKLKEKGELLVEDLKMEDAEIPLSENGKCQAKELGDKLENFFKKNKLNKSKTLILISPYKRARQTFEIANEKMKYDYINNHIFVINALREQSYGAFHMISKEVKKEVYEKIYNECQRSKISYFKPQFLGESPAEVSDRLYIAINFMKEFLNKHEIENIIIFGHRNVNKCIVMNILNLPPEFYDDFIIEDNASIISIREGKYDSSIVWE